jgi:hypothetical protein
MRNIFRNWLKNLIREAVREELDYREKVQHEALADWENFNAKLCRTGFALKVDRILANL